MKTLLLIGLLLFVGILITGIVLKWIVGVAWTLLVYGLVAFVVWSIGKSIFGRRGTNQKLN